MQSVPITTKVVSSNPDHARCSRYQHYVIKFVSDLRQVGGFLGYSVFLDQYNYIAESGANHHNPNPYSLFPNWRVSLSKICRERPSNAVTHECAQCTIMFNVYLSYYVIIHVVQTNIKYLYTDSYIILYIRRKPQTNIQQTTSYYR